MLVMLTMVAAIAAARLSVSVKGLPVPFHLQLLESIGAINADLYVQAIRFLCEDNDDVDDWSEVPENSLESLDNWSHNELYHNIMDHIDLDPVNRTFVDLQVGMFGPRIQSHYDEYHKTTQCKGSETFLVANDREYCEYEDLFALQLTRKSDMLPKLKSFDRIIGSNSAAPVLMLYGDIGSENFRQWFTNIYLSAESGKLRFVWRYKPTNDHIYPSEPGVNGYGVALIANQATDVDPDLGLKFASFVLRSPDPFTALIGLLETLPNDINKLRNIKVPDSVTEKVKANEAIGLSDGTMGLYINGAPVNRLELNAFKLIRQLHQEVGLVHDLIKWGFSMDQAKMLVSKLALHLAVQRSQYNGGNNRYRMYKHEFISNGRRKPDSTNPAYYGGVLFFNNIETDPNYLDFSTSPQEAYGDPNLRAGQIPALRENVHDLIFVIDMAQKSQLQELFSMSKIILDRAIPQQLGIVALGTTELDQKVAQYFYFLFQTTTAQEALAFLYQIYTTDNINEVLDVIDIGDYELDENYNQMLSTFAISRPSVVVNGIIYDLKDDWRLEMAKQITRDTQMLKQSLAKPFHEPKTLKNILFENARDHRDIRVHPNNVDEIRYKLITPELINYAQYEYCSLKSEKHVTLWIIGDLSLNTTQHQLRESLRWADQTKYSTVIKVIDTSTSDTITRHKALKFEITLQKQKQKQKPNLKTRQFLASQNLPPNHSFLLLNSRYLKLDSLFSALSLEDIADMETANINTINEIMHVYDHVFNGKLENVYNSQMAMKYHDWHDTVLSLLIKSFYVDDTLYVDDVARYDFSAMNLANGFVVDNDEPLVDVLVVVDPLLTVAPELMALTAMIIKVPFVRTRVVLQPKSIQGPITLQYFRGCYPTYPLFGDGGHKASGGCGGTVTFNEINDQSYSLNVVAPSRWQLQCTKSPGDLGDLKVNTDIDVEYKLSILIEGFAREITTGNSPQGTMVHVTKHVTNKTGDYKDINKKTMIMGNLGYFSVGVEHGISYLSCEGPFNLLSASSNAYDYNLVPQKEVEIDIFSIDGEVLRPRFSNNPNYTPHISQKDETVHIFTVAAGKIYEQLCLMMIMSVKAHTTAPVKIWLLEDHASAKFRDFLPEYSQKLGFDYEFVRYNWPLWLRRQSCRKRTLWGYKILFLDVLFPDLDTVIFIDADQINRSDLKELMELDMEDEVYGFVPMCESRPETAGYRFWKAGYWEKVLEGLPYHISALFKVNLELFRERGVGDKLRSHYQKLSADKNSLANLDQDLPNNLQSTVPIYSLDKEWLWCETWCSDDEAGMAKNIDLCANPLTGEDKMDMGRRLVDEWGEYERRLRELGAPYWSSDVNGDQNYVHDEL